MNNKRDWDYKFIIHPGEFLQDELEQLNITQIELSQKINVSKKTINQIIKGKGSITAQMAFRFEKILSKTVDYWINIQKIYDKNVLLFENEKHLEEEVSEYIDEIEDCYKDLVKIGIVEKFRFVSKYYKNMISELHRYFQVYSLGYFKKDKIMVNFRKYKRKKINDYSVAAWLHLGRKIAINKKAGKFDMKKLKDSLPLIKNLMLEKPKNYLIKLEELFLSIGIVLVYAPLFKNTHIQGATQWIEKDKICIMLMMSNQYEDKFWFNLFHEIGHILKHGKKEIFINMDGLNELKQEIEIKKEKEADEFAEEILLPNFNKKNLRKRDLLLNIKTLSIEYNVPESIIAGRITNMYGKEDKGIYAKVSSYMSKPIPKVELESFNIKEQL